MADFDTLDDEAIRVIRGREIEITEQVMLEKVARNLITTGNSQFEYGLKRFLLTKSGELHNPGYHVDTENLDGSESFRNSWSALSGDEGWQISCVIRDVARLLASVELP